MSDSLFDLWDRVVVVIGACGLFGHTLAWAFRERGALLAVVDVATARPEARAAEIGGNSVGLACDIWVAGGVTAGVAEVLRRFRRVDFPVNSHHSKEPVDFVRLLHNSQCLVGNSSVGIRECSFLGVPVVNVGSRQAWRDRGCNVVDVGYDRLEISRAIGERVATGRFPSDPLYGDGGAGVRIADLLATQPLTIEKRLTY